MRSDVKNRRRMQDAAFTLVELLVVIAIIGIVSAILLPVLVNGRKAGHRTTDISNLRQLATAYSLYENQFERPPISSVPLVLSELAPTSILRSNFDISGNGFANHFRVIASGFSKSIAEKPTSYRDSYLPIGDSGLNHTGIDLAAKENSFGWLISFSDTFPSNPTGGSPLPGDEYVWQGIYLRLTPNGSVLVRHHKISSGEVAGTTLIHNDIRTWFSDK